MGEQILHQLDHTTEALQYFTSTGVTFAASDDSLAATGIGTATFEVGDFISVSGSAQTANNTVWELTSVAAGKLIVDGSITDDNAGETIKINQEYQGAWIRVDQFATLTYAINCPQNATIYIDWSNSEGDNTDYSTSVDITGGTKAAAAVSTLAPWARFRIRNKDTDQATMDAYLNGKRET